MDKHGKRFIGLLRARYVVLGDCNFATVFSVLPLPDSRYIHDRPRENKAVNTQDSKEMMAKPSTPAAVSAVPTALVVPLPVAPVRPKKTVVTIGQVGQFLKQSGWAEEVFSSGDEGSGGDEALVAMISSDPTSK